MYLELNHISFVLTDQKDRLVLTGTYVYDFYAPFLSLFQLSLCFCMVRKSLQPMWKYREQQNKKHLIAGLSKCKQVADMAEYSGIVVWFIPNQKFNPLVANTAPEENS